MPTPDNLCRILELLYDLFGKLKARNDVGTPGHFLGSPQDGVATYHSLNWNGAPRGSNAYLAFAPYAWAQSGGATPLWVWVVDGLDGGIGNEHLDRLLDKFEGVEVQHRNDEENRLSLFIPIYIPSSLPAVRQVVNILERLRELAGGSQP